MLGVVENFLRNHENSETENRWLKLSERTFRDRTIMHFEEFCNINGLNIDNDLTNKINSNLVIIRDNQIKSNINMQELKNAYNNIKKIMEDL